MSDTGIDTAEFRELLETERGRLQNAVEYLHAESPGNMEDEVGVLGGRGADNHLADQASVTHDREVDQGLEEGAHDTVVQIDAALRRIDEGTYGICEACGKPVGIDRLRALPWAAFCIDDQRRLG